jgi:hypothetical protein
MDFQVSEIKKGTYNVDGSRVGTGASDYDVGVLHADSGSGYSQVGLSCIHSDKKALGSRLA